MCVWKGSGTYICKYILTNKLLMNKLNTKQGQFIVFYILTLYIYYAYVLIYACKYKYMHYI